MLDLIRELSNWVVEFADSDWALLALSVNSFTEAIFFPIPPDPLLIGISILQPERALWLAAITTASSVSGAVVGHRIGRILGRPIIYKLVAQKKVETAERLFQKYGTWTILVAAFTPLPYKVFTISAGILDLNSRSFIVASIIGRGARFFLIGALFLAFGSSIEEFINTHFELITISVAATILVCITLIVTIAKQRSRRESR